ncbi:hypothetical protein N7468_007028 [Penicillium chermesinum]|uniref:Uncharacterized protein n=1 Tax=Penicillium chermesinum TaxID=63820 RepID=A0A9W9NVQ2_9EURO|nr:uncharacterized protein N7468_007028 [Penicillium chermesinum]KAJ5225803.1 hypothetical protein N7468_007028 [Penicillium chermesinum]KAJ6160988.1 hypothetical protein N7470_004384 [Penicillium chermesinum]
MQPALDPTVYVFVTATDRPRGRGLEAVGLIAAITNRLKDHAISTNVVAGFFHDPIYVPRGRAEDTMRILWQLAEESK